MTPSTIVKEAAVDGVSLTLSSTGTIRAVGEREVVKRWLPMIREHKAAIQTVLRGPRFSTRSIDADDARTTFGWWRIHYPNIAPVEIACSPPASRSEILASRPDAIRAESFEPLRQRPNSPLSAIAELSIRHWLQRIGETDVFTIDHVLNACRTDADARDYFIQLAGDANESWLG